MDNSEGSCCGQHDWQLLNDNELLMYHVSYRGFLAKHQIIQVTQLPYSLDLVPCDLWFFPKLKSPLKGKRVQTTNERDSGKYNRAADGDWENCVRSQGAYFEGD